MLQNEREFARQTRDKLQLNTGHQSSNMGMGHDVPQSMGSGQLGGSAGPSSGKQYGGFGSEDIARLGYNDTNKFNAPYDPYTKGQSATSIATHQHELNKPAKRKKSDVKKKTKKSKKKKSKKEESSSSSEATDSDEDSDAQSSSEESEDEKTSKARKKREAKKEKNKGLSEAPKPTRQIGGVEVTPGTGAIQPATA